MNFLNFSDQNFSLVIVLSLFLIFGQISAWVFFYKVCSYKKKNQRVTEEKVFDLKPSLNCS